ncbi:MAG: imelysin family protein [Bacteroidota bacterium]
MNLKPIILCLILSLGLSFIGCNNEPSVDKPPFDREEMLRSLGENIILPAHQNFLIEATRLDSISQLFVQETSFELYDALQTQWKRSKSAWKYCEIYDILSVREQYLQNKVDKWPVKVRFIDENLESAEILDATFVENSGSTSKGLPALEYLLFDSLGIEVFKSVALAERRKEYLIALSENLLTQAETILSVWQTELPTFATNTENFSKGSLNELVNAQVAILEKMIANKINKPLGKSDGGIPQPNKCETYRSQTSYDWLVVNLNSFEQSITGSIQGASLLDLLDHSEAKSGEEALSTVISSQLKVCQDLMKANVNQPLSEQILTNPEPLEGISDALVNLLGLIKVDMANHLGIIITFNITDGD